MHDVSGRRFGATIYLNETWHPNSGGWFIWEDKNDGEWKVLPYDRNEQRFMDSSLIFQEYWKRARTNEKYLRLKEEFKNAIIEMES